MEKTKASVEATQKAVTNLQSGVDSLTKVIKNNFTTTVEQATTRSTAGVNRVNAAIQKVQEQVKVTTAYAQRSLMNFDQLQRLSADRVTSTTQQTTTTTQQMSQDYVAAGEKMKEVAKSIKSAFTSSLSSVNSSLDGLKGRIIAVAQTGISYIQALWIGAMKPFMEYLRREFFSGIINAFESLKVKLPEVLAKVTSGASTGFTALQKALKKSLTGLSDSLYKYVNALSMSVHISLMDMNLRIGSALKDFQKIMSTRFQKATVAGIGALTGLQVAINETSLKIRTGFTSAWKILWDTVPTVAKKGVNNTITVLNGLLSAVAASINGASDLLGSDSGIAVFGDGFQKVPKVKTPKIPYLAQGAVLPANKPFLAVVGDQKNGTNVEAPLGVIQEAVSAVTADQTAAILAGFEASVGVQKEILGAVLGISIGDEVIGKALHRYNQKRSVMQGGSL